MQGRDLVLGIDIGGTKTSFGFVDREGSIFNVTAMPTQADESAQTFVSRLHQRIEEIRVSLPSPYCLSGIGIGAPNAHHDRGTIEKSVNLNWGESVDFVGLIGKYYDLPVSITNDANAAALGEMLFGNARGMNFIVTLGTGLGSCIVAGGRRLWRKRFCRRVGPYRCGPGRTCVQMREKGMSGNVCVGHRSEGRFERWPCGAMQVR